MSSNPRPCHWCAQPEANHRLFVHSYKATERDQPLRANRSGHYLHEPMPSPFVTRKEVDQAILAALEWWELSRWRL